MHSANAQGIVRPGAFYQSTGTPAANAPQTIVAAGANLNGLIVWRAAGFIYGTSLGDGFTLIAKAAPPINIFDGNVLASPDYATRDDTIYATAFRLDRPMFVPAGFGLYFIASITPTASMKSCSYTLL